MIWDSFCYSCKTKATVIVKCTAAASYGKKHFHFSGRLDPRILPFYESYKFVNVVSNADDNTKSSVHADGAFLLQNNRIRYGKQPWLVSFKQIVLC